MIQVKFKIQDAKYNPIAEKVFEMSYIPDKFSTVIFADGMKASVNGFDHLVESNRCIITCTVIPVITSVNS